MGCIQAEQARLYNGPYEVLERVGPVNYKLRQPGRRHSTQLYHVNQLKCWHDPSQAPDLAFVVTYPPAGPPGSTPQNPAEPGTA